MRRDLGRLRIDKLIVHEIPMRWATGHGQPPTLSEVESPLAQGLKNYFREKITGSLRSAAYSVLLDPNPVSPVPALILDGLGGQKTDFVTISRKMAQHLHNCQTGVNPAGLLAVAQGSVAGLPCLAILKLEKEAGVRVQQTQYQGKTTFSLQHIRDLMLTEKTKVFKVGLFVQGGSTLETIEGAVSDKQRGYQPTKEVADFFLRKFLGCQLYEAPEITTKRFFEQTQLFINQEVTDAVVKARYQVALLAELGSEYKALSARSYAQKHLKSEDRQPYIEFLAQSGLGPEQFEKDTSLIQNRLKRMQLDFESGLAVLGSPESFAQHVKMKDLDNGLTRVEIEDRVKRVRSRR